MERLMTFQEDIDFAKKIYKIHLIMESTEFQNRSYVDKLKSYDKSSFIIKLPTYKSRREAIYATIYDDSEYNLMDLYMTFTPGHTLVCYFQWEEETTVLDNIGSYKPTEETHFQLSLIYTEEMVRAIMLYSYLNSVNASAFYLDLVHLELIEELLAEELSL